MIGQPRDLNFRGRTTFMSSNFFVICFAHHKNCPFNLLVFWKWTEKKTKEIKEAVYGACKTNNKEIWPNKSGFACKIHVSWLYFGDIKIRDPFVYKHILAPPLYFHDCQLQKIKKKYEVFKETKTTKKTFDFHFKSTWALIRKNTVNKMQFSTWWQ